MAQTMPEILYEVIDREKFGRQQPTTVIYQQTRYRLVPYLIVGAVAGAIGYFMGRRGKADE